MVWVPATWAQQWSQVQSPHFTVYTDAGEKRGREVALRFEQIHDAFGVILQKVRVNSPVPLTIIAFRNNKELSAFAPKYRGKTVQLAGFFQQGGDRDFIMVDLSSEGGWHVVYHEYGHLLVHTNLPPVPPWFDEGFAEYFATLHVDKRDIYFGEMEDFQNYILRSQRWMKSAYLFGIRHDSPEYNESGDHRSVFYAESWLVVHYLMDKRKMAEASKFLDLVQNQGKPIPEAFQSAFGMSTDKFDKELDGYFRGSGTMRYYRHPAPAGIAEGAYSSKPISGLDAEAELADLRFHSPEGRTAAVAEFKGILAKDPNNVIANRSLGYAETMSGQREEALPHIRKAVELDPKDGHSHYLYAYLLSQSEPFAVGYENSTPSDTVKTMQVQAEAAIAANPELADAYEILGRAQMMEHDNDAALASLKKAIELNPQDNAYRFNLANYLAMRRSWEAAKMVLKQVMASSDTSAAEMARMQLAEIERRQTEGPLPRMAHSGLRAPIRAADAAETSAVVVNLPVHYAKGKLLRVDCSADPAAKFVVDVAGKEWTFSAADRNHMVLLGEDKLSCDWHDRKVAINYREQGESQGEIVSLEMQ